MEAISQRRKRAAETQAAFTAAEAPDPAEPVYPLDVWPQQGAQRVAAEHPAADHLATA
jgi:hypothetical protein